MQKIVYSLKSVDYQQPILGLIVQAFYVKKRPFTEQIATEAFSTGFGLVRYPL